VNLFRVVISLTFWALGIGRFAERNTGWEKYTVPAVRNCSRFGLQKGLSVAEN
jgi:hypothetical protein